MKKILFLLIVSLAFASCDKKDLPEPKGQLDPNAMITLRPAASARATVPGLTALEIVEQAVNLCYQTYWLDNINTGEIKTVVRTFIEEHKNLENQLLRMWGTDIITQDGDYRKDFTNAFNVYITNASNDTIAYVPDAVINAARPLIEAAYEDENYTEVYRLFDEVFTFLPISE